jgi:ankyrin repeat protein
MDPNARHRGGWSALHVAAACNNAEACKLLLERGATVNSVDMYRPRGRSLEDIVARQEVLQPPTPTHQPHYKKI